MTFANPFTNCDSPLAVHNKLLTIMCCDYMDSEFCRPGFTRFMLNCRVHLSTPREKSLSDAHDICDALESKDLLGVGNYCILREMVADVDAELIDLIEKAKGKIEILGATADFPECKRRKTEQEPLMDNEIPDHHAKYLLEVLLKMNHQTTQRIQVSPLVKSSKVIPIDQIFAPVVLRNDLKSQRSWQNQEGKYGPGRNLLNSPNDIFYHDKDPARYVFMLGEAGRGKTVFCQQLLRHWCAAKQKSDNDKLSDWEKLIGEFDYVFPVSLRHVENTRTSVQDMICRDTFKSHKECHDAVRHVLSNDRYRCLVIMDGLDEWKVSQNVSSKLTYNGVPNVDSNSRCTFFFTFRPWKFDVVVDMVGGNDNVIEICGITKYGIELTIENMLLKYYEMDSSTQEFLDLKKEMLKKANDTKLKSIVEIPLLLTAAVQLWYEKKRATSMTSFYAAMVQLLIKRTINAKSAGKEVVEKLHENTASWTEKVPELLQCKNYKTMRNFTGVLYTLGKLAFEDLVSPETHLVFSTEELDEKIGKDDLEFALVVGLLSQCEAPGCFDEENVSVNFFHKTMQEFLAAFFMSVSKDVFPDFISKHLSNVKGILDLSNVIIFTCGLSLRLGNILIEQVLRVTENDPGVASWRRNFSWQHQYETRLVYKLLKSCYDETKHTQTQTNSIQPLIYNLPDIFLDDESEERVLKDTVETLSLQPDKLVSLFVLVNHIPSYKSEAESNLTHILTKANSLSYICIFGYGRTLYGIDEDIAIKTLILDKVNLTSEFIRGLQKSLESRRELQFLSLTWIRCKSRAHEDTNAKEPCDQEDKQEDRQTFASFKVETPYKEPTQESLSCIFKALLNCSSLVKFKINYRSLCTDDERLAFLHVLPKMSMLKEVHYIGSTDYNLDVDEFDEHKDVISRRPRNDEFDVEVARVFSKMPHLRQLCLRSVSANDNSFQLATNMSEIEYVELSEVYMSNESWCKFVESLTQINHTFRVRLSCTGISQYEELVIKISTCPIFTVKDYSVGPLNFFKIAPTIRDNIEFTRNCEHVECGVLSS